MKCGEVKKHLGAYIDGSLDENLEKRLKAHLQTCRKCSNEVLELKKYLNEVGSLNKISAPENFLEKVYGRLESESGIIREILALFTPAKIKIPIAAAAALTVAAAVVIFSRGLPYGKPDQIVLAPHKRETRQVEEQAQEKNLQFENQLEEEQLQLSEEQSQEEQLRLSKVQLEEEQLQLPEGQLEEKQLPAGTNEAGPDTEPEKGVVGGGGGIEEKIPEGDITGTMPEETSTAEAALETHAADRGIIEIALLVESPETAEPDITGMPAEEDLGESMKGKSIPDEKPVAGVQREKMTKKDESTIMYSTEAGPSLSTYSLEHALSRIRVFTLKAGGEIISVEHPNKTNMPLHIKVEVPSKNYTNFLSDLYTVGAPEGVPPPSVTAQEEDFVTLEINLMTSL